ncbi:MAG: cyclic nucleotide-binding domain-containing protein [Hyphomicrobiaceae bacterium]|nr:cyclic nucleotide-binding domain-containing protein [Hyphomicrobiaceae bacterium]
MSFDTILAISHFADHAKHTLLNQQGDTASHLLVVTDGWIKLFRQTTGGDEAVMAVLTRGDIFGEAAIIAGASYPFAAEAAEPSRLMRIPGAVLRQLARDNHEIMAQIMRIMSRELKSPRWKTSTSRL